MLMSRSSSSNRIPDGFGGKIHDVSGKDGMEVISKIISGFSQYVNKDGRMYLLLFDFLLDKTVHLCKQSKLDVQIVAYYNKYLRKGGETEKRKKVIEDLFFGYVFREDTKGLYHRVYILEITNTLD